MFPWFSALSLANKAIAVAVALALIASIIGGAYLWAYNRGHEAGYGDGQRTQLDLDKQAFQSDRKVFLDTLSAAQRVNDEAKQVIAQKDSELTAIKSRRLAAVQSVHSLPAAQVIPDIRQRLGEPSAGVLSEDDYRKLDEALAVGSSLEAQVQALQDKSEQQDIRISAVEKQRDAAILAYNQLVPLYTKAFNAAQRRRSIWVKIFTLGLVRDKKLDLPAPVTMTR